MSNWIAQIKMNLIKMNSSPCLRAITMKEELVYQALFIAAKELFNASLQAWVSGLTARS